MLAFSGLFDKKSGRPSSARMRRRQTATRIRHYLYWQPEKVQMNLLNNFVHAYPGSSDDVAVSTVASLNESRRMTSIAISCLRQTTLIYTTLLTVWVMKARLHSPAAAEVKWWGWGRKNWLNNNTTTATLIARESSRGRQRQNTRRHSKMNSACYDARRNSAVCSPHRSIGYSLLLSANFTHSAA